MRGYHKWNRAIEQSSKIIHVTRRVIITREILKISSMTIIYKMLNDLSCKVSSVRSNYFIPIILYYFFIAYMDIYKIVKSRRKKLKMARTRCKKFNSTQSFASTIKA